MNTRIIVQAVAAIVVAVFAIGIWLTGGTLEVTWLRFYAAAVLAALGAIALWEWFIWRLPLVQKIPIVPRNINGTWKGTLTSFWKDPATGESPSPKTVYLVIRQNSATISVAMLSEESRSTSSLARLTTSAALTSLDYMYLNRPDNRFEHKSRMHHGSASLDVSGKPAIRLCGRYWTDRDSRGELDFTERHRHPADDFKEAKSLFSRKNRATPRPARNG